MVSSKTLAVPHRRPGHAYWAALTTLLAAVGYALTAQTAPGFHDAAELALRAAQLGATHAPGAPLHTVLGFAATALVVDPAAATTWISVAAAAFTAGAVTWLVAQSTRNPWLCVAAGLAYAALYSVWTNAVVTELYALSTFLVTALLCSAWRWRAGVKPELPLTITIIYGLALSTHFANVVLLPAYGVLLLLASQRGAGARHLLGHGSLLVLSVLAVAGANALLAARVPPFGMYVPDSLRGLLGYMSGAEHAPLQGAVLSHYLGRFFEHVMIIARGYAFVGLPFVLLGLYRVVRDDAAFALFQILFFGGYMGYFTLFGPGDYFVMVVPGYVLMSVWLALGAELACMRWLADWPRAGSALLPLALLGWCLATQTGQRRAEAAAAPALAYSARAFAALPRDSLVVARWNEFTVMRYRQVVDGQRDDLDLIVPARSTRHYAHGVVPDYLQRVAASICVRPVVTNKRTPELEAIHDLRPLGGSSEWLRVYPVSAELCEPG